MSIAVVDSDTFKGTAEVHALETRTRDSLASYCTFGRAPGLRVTSAFSFGTEVALEAEKLGVELLALYPGALVIAGQIIFDEDTGWNWILHNETAFMIQRRLQRVGVPRIVLPVQLDLKPYARRRPRSLRRHTVDVALG